MECFITIFKDIGGEGYMAVLDREYLYSKTKEELKQKIMTREERVNQTKKDIRFSNDEKHLGAHWTKWLFVNERSKRIAYKDHRVLANVWRVINIITLEDEGTITDSALFNHPDWTRVRGSEDAIDHEVFNKTAQDLSDFFANQ